MGLYKFFFPRKIFLSGNGLVTRTKNERWYATVLLCSGREAMPLLLDDLDMTGYAFPPVTGQGAG
jgi:hypothetical protein